MRVKLIAAMIALLPAIAAHAATCEEEFTATGDARNGLEFFGARNVPGLKPDSAIGQMEGIAKLEGFELGSPILYGDYQELLFTQTNLSTPLVISAKAYAAGRVVIRFKLAKGQAMTPEQGRTSICEMLGKLRTGPEGEALARAGHAGNAANAPIDGTAVEISAKIRADVDRTMAGANTPSIKDFLLGTHTPRGQRADLRGLHEALRQRYVGKRYILDGQVYTLGTSNGLNIDYLVAPKRGLLNVQADQGFGAGYFSIKCKFAKDQAQLFSTLDRGSWVKLEGVVDDIDEGGMRLRDCRQAR